MKRLSVSELEWLALLVDTCGVVSISKIRGGATRKNRRGYGYRASVVVSSAEAHDLMRAHTLTDLGGVWRRRDDRWEWILYGGNACSLLKGLLPYLKVNKAQAENMIRFQSTVRHPGRNGFTDAEWQFRERCRLDSLILNVGKSRVR